MDEKETVFEQLNALLNLYDFNADTLSGYLGLPVEQLKGLARGETGTLPEDLDRCFGVFVRIQLLFACAAEEKDLKLAAFLQVLLSHHRLSKKTLAKMAGVEPGDIDALLARPGRINAETKYKIAVTAMALSFFLKDGEPPLP